MRLLTYTVLTGCSKARLWELLREMHATLPCLPEGSAARANALMNIHHIRMFLARRDYTPC